MKKTTFLYFKKSEYKPTQIRNSESWIDLRNIFFSISNIFSFYEKMKFFPKKNPEKNGRFLGCLYCRPHFRIILPTTISRLNDRFYDFFPPPDLYFGTNFIEFSPGWSSSTQFCVLVAANTNLMTTRAGSIQGFQIFRKTQFNSIELNQHRHRPKAEHSRYIATVKTRNGQTRKCTKRWRWLCHSGAEMAWEKHEHGQRNKYHPSSVQQSSSLILAIHPPAPRYQRSPSFAAQSPRLSDHDDTYGCGWGTATKQQAQEIKCISRAYLYKLVGLLLCTPPRE